MDITAAIARRERGPLDLAQVQIERPRADEVLVRVVATGICHTDLSMRDRLYPVPQPLVLGHEGAGIVEEVGSAVTKVAVGDPVVMSFNFCGGCASCLADRPHYCHDFFGYNFGGVRPDGSSPISDANGPVAANFFGQSSFATRAICSERNIVKVPADADLALLGPLACGIMTGAGAVLNVLDPRPGDSVVIFGAGTVGLSAVMAARLTAATQIVAVDLNPDRLTLARNLGATHVINASHEDPVAEIAKVTGAGADKILEATGLPHVIRQAADSLAPRGVLGMVGAASPMEDMALSIVSIMTGGRVVRGIVEGEATPQLFIPQLIELHRQGRFPFDRLVRFYDFTDINQAIQDSEEGRTIKAIVKMPA